MVIVPLNKEEVGMVAKVMAEKLNKSTGPTAVIIPTRGFSPGGKKGRPYYDPERDKFFIKTLKENLRPDIPVVEIDAYLNDPIVAEKATSLLLEFMR